MRLDPRVSARKFAREVELLETQRSSLASWGCFVADVSSSKARIDVVLVARRSLILCLPVTASPAGLIQLSGPVMAEIAVAPLAARAIGLRIDLTDYDQLPPSVQFLDPFSWEPIPFGQLPRGFVAADGPAMQVLLDVHPRTRLPFLCMRGVREYHEHPQHTGDEWAMYRAGSSIFTLLDRATRAVFRDTATRLIVGGPHAIQVNWSPAGPG